MKNNLTSFFKHICFFSAFALFFSINRFDKRRELNFNSKIEVEERTMIKPEILVIDLSSQVADLISRTLRELGYRSVIYGPDGSRKWLEKNKPKCIILSGGEQSVHDVDAQVPPKEILDLGVPIFGICYGMQWLAHVLGGQVVTNRDVNDFGNKNYGEAQVAFNPVHVFSGDFGDHEHTVWASHGDSVKVVPPGFHKIAQFKPSGVIASMYNAEKKILAVQFHPEVKQTLIGPAILEKFVDLCGCEKNWSSENLIEKKRSEMVDVIGDKKAILGYSGGVDSSVTCMLAAPILKDRMLAVVIDTGALRQNELEEILSNGLASRANIKCVDDSVRFFDAIGHTIDAEEKRLAFRGVYFSRLDSEGDAFGASFLLQGTNKADKVESGDGGSSHIKSHHNTGESKLPKYNPLGDLYKYEIRDLALKLGLPESIAFREPFPGPGLFLRVNGILVTRKNTATVRWADYIARGILRKHNIHKEISQCPVSLNGVPTVGIKGDGRVYKYSIVLHPVVTSDFMTSVGYQINPKVRKEITRELQKHPEIVRVLYDEGDKPPASTEWE